VDFIDKKFWDIAYRNNSTTLLSVLRRYVGDSNVAHDLLHDVFITAIGKHETYTGKGRFEGWLYKIAVNTALMHIRSHKNIHTEIVDDISDAYTSDVEDVPNTKDARGIIEAANFSNEELLYAIDQLPEHHKIVFNMHVMDGYSHKCIAEQLDIAHGTSKAHLARARKKIQQTLYQDATSKHGKKQKRRVFPFIFFPFGTHHIDRLYKNSWSGANTATTASFFGGSTASYLTIACATAIISSTLTYIVLDSDVYQTDTSTNIINKMDMQPVLEDTIRYSPQDNIFNIKANDETQFIPKNEEVQLHNYQEPEKEDINKIADNQVDNQNDNNSDNEDNNEPIVVTKQIIDRQVITIRDTIYIYE
jgi:RNA polymerase sigma factor (sigma-70 family)